MLDHRFDQLSINVFNVSWSGATVNEIDLRDRPNERALNGNPNFSDAINRLGMTAASRQMNVLNDRLRRQGHEVVDIMGFTFGGNDTQFAKIVKEMLTPEIDIDFRWDPEFLSPSTWLPRFIITIDQTWTTDERISDRFFHQWVNIAESRLENFSRALQQEQFGFEVRKTIYGNYPNPLGSADRYTLTTRAIKTHPTIAGVIDSLRNYPLVRRIVRKAISNLVDVIRPLLSINALETRDVKRNLLPGMSAMARGNNQRFAFASPELADTYSVLPINHRHGMNSDHPWFRPIAQLDEDNEVFKYNVHPNTPGHESIYRPIYRDALIDCLESGYQETSFAQDAKLQDLVIEEARLAYEPANSRLYIRGRIRNQGQAVSSPSFIRLHTLFDDNEPTDQIFSFDEFSTIVTDIDGDPVEIHELQPGQSRFFSTNLLVGPEDFVSYSFIFNHFKALRDEQVIQDILGDAVDDETLIRRLTA